MALSQRMIEAIQCGANAVLKSGAPLSSPGEYIDAAINMPFDSDQDIDPAVAELGRQSLIANREEAIRVCAAALGLM